MFIHVVVLHLVVVVAGRDVALDSLVCHEVKKLQTALVALDVRHEDRHLVLHIGRRDIRLWGRLHE